MPPAFWRIAATCTGDNMRGKFSLGTFLLIIAFIALIAFGIYAYYIGVQQGEIHKNAIKAVNVIMYRCYSVC
jgi:hypothetical protein